MIKTTIIIVMTLLCLNFGSKADGKSQQELALGRDEGNTNFTVNGTQGSKIKIRCWRNQIFKYDSFVDSIITLTGQETRFSLKLDKIAYLEFAKLEANKVPKHTNFLLNEGDELHFNFEGQETVCTGKGSERFIVNVKVASTLSKLRVDSNILRGMSSVEKQMFYEKVTLEAKIKVWEDNQMLFNRLSYYKSIIDLIGLSDAKRFSVLLTATESKTFKEDPIYAQAVRNTIARELAEKHPIIIDPNLAYDSYGYRQALITKAQIAEQLNGKLVPGKETEIIFNYLDDHYTGELKGFLLTQWLSRKIKGTDPQRYSVLLNRLSAIANHQVLKKTVAELKRATGEGIKIYIAGLPDVSENLVRLSNYKGKVLVVDFWYTGCGNCILYGEQTLTPAYEKLKQDTNIVFLSISIDKDKDVWLKSLKSGSYTLPKSINLYTGGMGAKNPVIDYYQVTSYPHLLVIDKKGTTFSNSYTAKDPNLLVALLTRLKTTN